MPSRITKQQLEAVVNRINRETENALLLANVRTAAELTREENNNSRAAMRLLNIESWPGVVATRSALGR